MSAITGIKEALVASLGDLYSKDDSSLAVAEQEAIANVIESLFSTADVTTKSPIIAASRNGICSAIDALGIESDWYSERRRLSSSVDGAESTVEEKPPFSTPVLGSSYADFSFQHSWSSGAFEIVLSEDVSISDRIIFENHISPWVCVSYGGELTEDFLLGTTGLL